MDVQATIEVYVSFARLWYGKFNFMVAGEGAKKAFLLPLHDRMPS